MIFKYDSVEFDNCHILSRFLLYSDFLKYDFWKCDNFNLLSAELLINLYEFLHLQMDISDSLEIQDQSQVFGATQDQDQESDEELLPQNKFPP